MTLTRDSFIEYYERLRSEVLNKQTGNGSGLALLMRKGTLHWMESCSYCFDCSKEKRKLTVSPDSGVVQPELTALLTTMVMLVSKEAFNDG